MIKKFCAVVCALMIVISSILYGATTGKIVGQIKDKANGQPLIGANVILEGTMMGCSVDSEGKYLINNVPPGIYNLRISMMGYSNHRVENVRVRMDLRLGNISGRL